MARVASENSGAREARRAWMKLIGWMHAAGLAPMVKLACTLERILDAIVLGRTNALQKLKDGWREHPPSALLF